MRFSPPEVEVNEACANCLKAIERAALRRPGLFCGTAASRNGRTR